MATEAIPPDRTDVFILGAGFSASISAHMPVMSRLTELVFDHSTWPGTRPPTRYSLNFGDDLELWLTFLATDHPWLSEAENHRNRADFIDACAVLTNVLYQRQEEVIAHAPSPPGWLTELVAEWDRRRTTVITLNYDTLVEKAFVQQAQNPKRDHSLLYPVPPTNIRLRNAGTLGGAREPTFSLLKLHGSVNWCYSGAPTFYGETIYDIPMAGAGWVGGDTREYYTAMARDKQPLIVPPTATKTALFDNETVRANWRAAADALANADNVFCLGYSLPAADLPMRYLMSNEANPLTVIPADINPKILANYSERLPGRFHVSSDYCGIEEAIPTLVRVWIDGSA